MFKKIFSSILCISIILTIEACTFNPQNTQALNNPLGNPSITPTPIPSQSIESISIPDIDVPEVKEAYIGEPISYKEGVSYSDTATLDINTDNVDKNTPGKYTIIYTATNASGVSVTATSTLILKNRDILQEDANLDIDDENTNVKENNSNIKNVDEIIDNIPTPTPVSIEELVDSEVSRLSQSLFTPDMNQTQKARAIYSYVENSIQWKGVSNERDLISGAYAGLVRKSGDCYAYYAAAKTLLDTCGIPNTTVVRATDDPSNLHWWLLVNTGSGWYHFDAAAKSRTNPFNGFMRTDEDVFNYSLNRTDGRIDYYSFDQSLYTQYPRATIPFE